MVVAWITDDNRIDVMVVIMMMWWRGIGPHHISAYESLTWLRPISGDSSSVVISMLSSQEDGCRSASVCVRPRRPLGQPSCATRDASRHCARATYKYALTRQAGRGCDEQRPNQRELLG